MSLSAPCPRCGEELHENGEEFGPVYLCTVRCESCSWELKLEIEFLGASEDTVDSGGS